VNRMELRRPQYELEIWRLHESRALGACVEERHSVCSNFEKSSVHESFFKFSSVFEILKGSFFKFAQG